MVTEQGFCLFVSVVILLCYCHFLTMLSWKKFFFLKSFVGLSQNVQQPKATHYTYILVIHGRYLTILISMYLFPCLYSICSCFFLGGEVVGWWGNTPVNPILHYSHILRWSRDASNIATTRFSGVSFGHHNIWIGRTSERNKSLPGRSCWLSLVPLKI